ncbi:uncharacterized protein ACA1_065420 [Acanthamoeba castellanii str. Neff]|uniref:Uncharacterized protein n=1 Tax=Acanthamoeba castellanii (strain ATCC 30010 / Neff) TaxID=1257118 RepID=L8GYY0_ACACF|nr:uncharacterized protein ACA1_065420 [Acanthamoeba castellanii str. Neff]ELR17743.1 hypothetical protein ACA1_065420 [Acanthamoeba castellanii str. Neff]
MGGQEHVPLTSIPTLASALLADAGSMHHVHRFLASLAVKASSAGAGTNDPHSASSAAWTAPTQTRRRRRRTTTNSAAAVDPEEVGAGADSDDASGKADPTNGQHLDGHSFVDEP